jgi:hypothetical protein
MVGTSFVSWSLALNSGQTVTRKINKAAFKRSLTFASYEQ